MLTPFIFPSLLQQNGDSGTSPGLQKLLNRWQMPGGTKTGTPGLLMSPPSGGVTPYPIGAGSGSDPVMQTIGKQQPVMTAHTSGLSPQGPANNAAQLPGIDFPPATGVGSNPTGGYGTGPGQNPFAGATPGGTIIGPPTAGQNPFAGATAGGTIGTQLPAGFTAGPTGQLIPVGGRFGGSGGGSPGYGGVSSSVNAPYSGGGGYGSWGSGGGGYRSWADAIDMGY